MMMNLRKCLPLTISSSRFYNNSKSRNFKNSSKLIKIKCSPRFNSSNSNSNSKVLHQEPSTKITLGIWFKYAVERITHCILLEMEMYLAMEEDNFVQQVMEALKMSL